MNQKETTVHKHTNRLIHEKSPYLLQHAHNPVNWVPWGEEAFETARLADKPIFLSIGYATCHWCHVMEHESFENEEIAALLNEAFVCIKVDREERPDIDEIYMTVCQMMTRSGGWPLTIVMTPEKKPFFAATYIPPENRFGRTGMIDLIPQISNAWKTRRAELLNSANQISAALAESTSASGELDDGLLDEAYRQAEQSYDTLHGGFGGAPKFPTAHRLNFLMRQNPVLSKRMVLTTLHELRQGGIWDQVGHGIHRYSTDREWLVPHFEKMLYDQALLALACIEAVEAYGDESARRTAEEIFEYVLRDMTSPGGGFYSAEDADSEGVEGKFYVWSLEELRTVLNKQELALAVELFNVEPDGNFRDEATRAKTGENILHRKNPPRPSATPPEEGNSEIPSAGGAPERRGGFEPEVKPEWWSELDSEFKIPSIGGVPERRGGLDYVREKLFAAREKRIHPLKDTKVLADWNGLMIAALAKAARVFDEPKYEKAAQRAADFVFVEMGDDDRLWHRWREGHTAVPGQLDDYAFMISGLLELYETTFDFQWLEKAIALNAVVLEKFQDLKNGGFYLTADDAEKLLIRPKSLHDGALPSGNSVQMMNLLRLARLTGRSEYETLAEKTLGAFAETINRSPSGFSQALQALQFAEGQGVEIVIVGERGNADTDEMIRVVRSVYLPNKVVLLKEPDDSKVIKLAPYTKGQKMIDGKATVYICRNFGCEAPLTDPKKVRDSLSGK